MHLTNEERLRQEIDTVLADKDFAKMEAESAALASLAKSLAENTENNLWSTLGAFTAAMAADCAAQDVEAMLRHYKSELWLGATVDVNLGPMNMACPFAFAAMAEGIYKNPGSYRENYEKLPTAKLSMTVIY